jgi:chloramphenicol O-acetyltransferase type A
MKKPLDLNNWPRKDHFHFFRKFEEPFFGVCVQVDCTKAYETAKANGYSFFLYYLYQSLKAANAIEPFRYRIIDDEVFVYDNVHASPTINRPDGTFGFAYMDYKDNLNEFILAAKQQTERVQQEKGLVPAMQGENVIHYSAMPWISFTGLSHARSFSYKDSIPKISFGKVTEVHGRKQMPVSVHVHHALLDGFHVGQYISQFEQLMHE